MSEGLISTHGAPYAAMPMGKGLTDTVWRCHPVQSLQTSTTQSYSRNRRPLCNDGCQGIKSMVERNLSKKCAPKKTYCGY